MHFTWSSLDPCCLDSRQSVFTLFCLASWVPPHQGEGLAELEVSGGTSVCHSFQEADTSNELVPDKVSAFARGLVTSQHLTLPLISPALSFSSETERKK